MAKYIVQHRRGTAAQWADKDTIIPKEGEIVIEIDEENSLHKLKIGDGVHTYAELAYLTAGDDIVTQVLAQALPRVTTVTLDVDKWEKVTYESDPKLGYYSQLITVDGITEYSKLDLRPSADMLAEFADLNIAFVTENRRGVMFAYSIGDVPVKSYEMQATITETDMSADHDAIIGMTVGTPTVALPLVGVKGVDNAFVQTTEETEVNNLAVSQSSIALGEGSIAGSLGYYFDYIYGYTEDGVKKGKVKLCKTQPDTISISLQTNGQVFDNDSNKSFEVPGYDVGNKINIDCGNHYKAFGEIVSIENNVITFIGDVEKFSNDMVAKVESGVAVGGGSGDTGNVFAMKEPGYDDYTFSVVEHPDVGVVEVAKNAVAIGVSAKASAVGAYSEGRDTQTIGNYGHTEGRDTVAGYCAHAQNRNTRALGNNSSASGSDTEATGAAANSRGRMTEAKGDYSDAQGKKTVAEGESAFSGGVETYAKGDGSVSFGRKTEALADYSVALNIGTVANGTGATALGWGDLEKGTRTIANGRGALATGIETKADAEGAMTAGIGTIAKEKGQAVVGSYNADDEDAIVIFGNGADDNNRSNAGAVTKRGFKLSETQFGTEDMQEGDFLPCGVFYFVYDKNIKFTLDTVSYKVADDVTWGEWVETTGAAVGFGVTADGVVTFATSDTNGVKCVENSKGNVVWAEDYIQINDVYTSGHINPEAYGQETFYADASTYMGKVEDFSFSKIGSYGFDEKYIKKISSDDVTKEIASRAIAGAAIYNTDSSYYYNVTEGDDSTFEKTSKLRYFFAHNYESLYIGIEDNASTTWIEEDGSEGFVSRNNYNIRIGLDKEDYSKCLVALIGANKGAGTTDTDVFTLKAYDSRKTANYGVDDHNVITNMAIMKRTFDEYGKIVGGTSSNIVSPSPYIAYIKYEINKAALINMWNTAFGTALTELPSEICILVSCVAYYKDGKTVVSNPCYGSVLSKTQMDVLMPTTITSGSTKQCPVLPHIIKIDNSVVETEDSDKVTFTIDAGLGVKTVIVDKGITWENLKYICEDTNDVNNIFHGDVYVIDSYVCSQMDDRRIVDSNGNYIMASDIIVSGDYSLEANNTVTITIDEKEYTVDSGTKWSEFPRFSYVPGLAESLYKVKENYIYNWEYYNANQEYLYVKDANGNPILADSVIESGAYSCTTVTFRVYGSGTYYDEYYNFDQTYTVEVGTTWREWVDKNASEFDYMNDYVSYSIIELPVTDSGSKIAPDTVIVAGSYRITRVYK